MAKRSKFPLKMKDEVKVRTLEEMRENFDLEKLIKYYVNEKLIIWVNDRYYYYELEQISKLNIDDVDFKEKLCEILSCEYEKENKVNVQHIKMHYDKIKKLEQFDCDEDIINNIEDIAFTQQELENLLLKEKRIIYIFQEELTFELDDKKIKIPNSFRINSNIKNVKFIGITKSILKIYKNDKNIVDEDIKTSLMINGVEFENVKLEITVDIIKVFFDGIAYITKEWNEGITKWINKGINLNDINKHD